MSFYGLRLGCLELALERHSTTSPEGFAMRVDEMGGLVIDAGRSTIMISVFKPRRLFLLAAVTCGIFAATLGTATGRHESVPVAAAAIDAVSKPTPYPIITFAVSD